MPAYGNGRAMDGNTLSPSIDRIDNIEDLSFAAYNGNIDIIKKILQNLLRRPLITAIMSAQSNAMNFLLECGADINFEDEKLGSPLFVAISVDSVPMVNLVLQKGALITESLLISAVSTGNSQIVKLLIDKGADINELSGQPLFTAIEEGRDTIVQQLIEHGAQVNHTHPSYGTPLLCAVKKGRLGPVELLLQQGSHSGSEAIELAAFNGDNDIISTLIRYRVPVVDGYANGFLAALLSKQVRIDIMETMLATGIDVNQRCSHLHNYLQAAALSGHADVIRLLLRHGAKVNDFGGLHGTALQAAVCIRDPDCVEALIQGGANVFHKGRHGDNIYAAFFGATEALRSYRQYIEGVSGENKSRAISEYRDINHRLLAVLKILKHHGCDWKYEFDLPKELAADKEFQEYIKS